MRHKEHGAGDGWCLLQSQVEHSPSLRTSNGNEDPCRRQHSQGLIVGQQHLCRGQDPKNWGWVMAKETPMSTYSLSRLDVFSKVSVIDSFL